MVEGRDVWWHDIVERQAGRLPAGPARLRAHALPALHVGDDGQAEGHHPHDGRLPRRHVLHPRDDLRHQARRRVLVRRRRRLGDRPQLHRLRAARQRDDRACMYEGSPDTPGWDRWWQIIEDYKVTILYCAPTAIRAFMKQGAEHPGEARPVVAARPRLGRRADQPRGVALVPRAHRRRQGADRRHVVADRDRPDPDHAAARASRRRSPAARRSRSRASTPTSSTATATPSRSAAAATSS